MDSDFKDLLSTFNAHSVQYLIIGGYAYAEYAEPRTTKDLDLFVNSSPPNAAAVFRCLQIFGANLTDVTAKDFESTKTIFQIGVAPFRIDVLCGISGVSFDEAWETSKPGLIDNEVPVRYISLEKLIQNKLASGRDQDLVDVKKLRKSAG
jgi:Nucleotidyl transferase of unknown function (DUF2204)